MAKYKSLRTSDERAVIKGERRVPVLDGDKIADYDWLDGVYADFKNYEFSTSDADIIKWMDNPKNGYGVGWVRLEDAEPVADTKDGKKK